jgi:hypothetical protein
MGVMQSCTQPYSGYGGGIGGGAGGGGSGGGGDGDGGDSTTSVIPGCSGNTLQHLKAQQTLKPGYHITS